MVIDAERLLLRMLEADGGPDADNAIVIKPTGTGQRGSGGSLGWWRYFAKGLHPVQAASRHRAGLKSEQGDKWSFCLTAGTIAPRIRRDNEQTTAPEPHAGLQGEGGACGHQGREHWLSWRSSSTSTPIRSRRGKPSSRVELPMFSVRAAAGVTQPTVDVKSLHAKIGELTLENDFLEGALGKAGLLSAKR